MCLFQSKGPSLHARQAAAGNAGQPPKTTAVTAEDVEKVQLLVETCLQHLYTMEETQSVLERSPYFVDRRFVQIIWHRLEKENQEFFASYNKALQERLYKHVEL